MDYQKIMQRFDEALVSEQVRDLQNNPHAGRNSDEPIGPERSQKVAKWNMLCRSNAFIFDDTYRGMPLDDAIRIMFQEGFEPAGQSPMGSIQFVHRELDIIAVPRAPDSKLASILMDVILRVKPDSVNAQTCCGLGLIDPNVVDNTLITRIDATGGLRVKMAVLLSMTCPSNLASSEHHASPS